MFCFKSSMFVLPFYNKRMYVCINDWSVSLENGTHQTAYVDFAKAFDSVCHSKLVAKLRQYGIEGSLLEWIGDFLSGRSHRTRVGASYLMSLAVLFKAAALGLYCSYCS